MSAHGSSRGTNTPAQTGDHHKTLGRCEAAAAGGTPASPGGAHGRSDTHVTAPTCFKAAEVAEAAQDVGPPCRFLLCAPRPFTVMLQLIISYGSCLIAYSSSPPPLSTRLLDCSCQGGKEVAQRDEANNKEQRVAAGQAMEKPEKRATRWRLGCRAPPSRLLPPLVREVCRDELRLAVQQAHQELESIHQAWTLRDGGTKATTPAVAATGRLAHT
jgi:hypothetical protein